MAYQANIWLQNLTVLKILSKASKEQRTEAYKAAKNAAAKIVSQNPLKVSVIIPMWNRANVVENAIKSVLGQSFLPHEIILSDDGSTDNSVKNVTHTFKPEIEKGLIKLIQNSQNLGPSAARNAALKIATGDLISYLDTDNTWRRDYLLLMTCMFAEAPNLSCAYAGLHTINKDKDLKYTLARQFDRKKLLRGNFIDMNVFMHTRELYKQKGGFNEELSRLEDWEMILRYTKEQTPPLLPVLGADYYIDTPTLKNISTRVNHKENFDKLFTIHAHEMAQYGYSLSKENKAITKSA